jgi:D-alanine-D-alanine ligase
MPRKPRVAVVFGGRSSEHAISCVTAGSVLAALDRDRYDVVPVGITEQGRWVLAPDDPAQFAITAGELPRVQDAGADVSLPTHPARRDLVLHEPGAVPTVLGEVDVVFPLLHGPYGEDGTIQGMLELAGVPYVGSGVLASAASMDKDVMKRLLSSAGLAVGEFAVLAPGQWDRDPVAAAQTVARLGWPVFVKPARGGSSIGIGKVTGPQELEAAVREAERWDPKLVVEAAITGREVECGVLGGLGGAPAEASLPAEIRVVGAHDFYDFEAKYLDDATELDVPAKLDEETTERVRRLAVEAFDAMGCEGLARVDFFLTDAGELIVNELNTMPGFTPASMFPRMWAATGVDYPALVDRLLQLALTRSTGLR